MATPKPAPDETPRIDGPASGLLKVVCNSKPDTDNAAPASAAVAIMGRRDCRMMMSHALLPLPLPVRISAILPTGMSTEPNTRQASAKSTSSKVNMSMVTAKRRYVMGASVNVKVELLLVIREEFGMQDGGKLPQEYLGMEGDAVKEAGLVGVADVDTLVLKRRHLLVEVKGALQVLQRVDMVHLMNQ